VNIFFDVDYTILSSDQALRPGTRETFARLIADGHQVYIWSGEGPRWPVVRHHQLDDYVSGVFGKPLSDFGAGLQRLEVSPTPDFVVDDYPAIVRYFGGYFIPEFYFSDDDDDELESVYQVISEFASLGRADHHRWRPRLLEAAL
jgi:phosphoglycolate phosphatase-like HAD superfamily hydrolase